jgi:ectoine hydroxylase-related dioxygenase (phytanoyl-CoA dioxygenase family)
MTTEHHAAIWQRATDMATDQVVAEYWERGYWRSPKLLTDAQVAALRTAHERLWAGDFDRQVPSQYGPPHADAGSTKLRQQCNAFWLNDAIRATVTDPLIGALAARLMRVPTVRLWHDQAIYKPGAAGVANAGGNVGWHQDYGFWQCASTTNMITVWIALQDTDLNNGGMRTIVGSHRWGLVEESATFSEQDLEGMAATYAARGSSAWLDEPCILRAGEASFHHALTFHGSGPNTSTDPRLSVVAHLMPGDTVYRAGRQWHQNTVFLGPDAYDGQPFTGPYFPQLWPIA